MAFKAPTKDQLTSFENQYNNTKDTKLDKAMGSLYQTESGGRQSDSEGNPITSPKGAVGIAQIMPTTGPDAADMAGVDWDEDKFKQDPEYNKQLGKAYFKTMLAKFDGDYPKAYAAYNAGPGNVQKALDRADATGSDWKEHLPDETKDYVRKNMANLGTADNNADTDRKPSSRKFAPPTPEQLDKFNKKPDEGSNIGDTARGLAQGLTLGGSDEIAGGLEAAKDYITDPKVKSMQDLLDRYRQHQKESEAANDAAKARSPILYGGANLVGSVPAAVMAMKSGGSDLGSRMNTMGGVGALTGALSSKGTLGSKEQVNDASEGAAMGVLSEGAGAGLSAGLSASQKKLADLSKEYDLIKKLGVATNRGLEGKGFISNTNKNEITTGTKNLAEDIANKLQDTGEYASKKYKAGINSINRPIGLSSENIQPLANLSESFGKYIDNPNSTLESFSNAPSMKASLDNALKGNATPQELKNLSDSLRKIDPSSALYGSAQSAIKAIEKTNINTLGEVYPEINKTYRQDKELKEALTSDVPESARSREIGDSNNPDELIYNKSKDILNNSGRDYSDAKKGLNRLNQFADKIEEIKTGRKPGMEGPVTGTDLKPVGEGPSEQGNTIFNHNIANPDLLEAGGLNDNTLIDRIRKQSDLEGTLHKMQGTEFTSDSPLLSINTGQRGLLYGANLGAQSVSYTADLAKKVYSMGAEPLMGIAEALSRNNGTKHLGNGLADALRNPGTTSKNAILFSIMQNPEARKTIGAVIPGVESENGK